MPASEDARQGRDGAFHGPEEAFQDREGAFQGRDDTFRSREAVGWRRRWSTLAPRWRWLGVAGVLVVLLVVGAVLVRDRQAAHRAAERVAVTVTLAVATSSASPPGGAVNYALLVRNDGPGPVVVTSVSAGSERLVLRPWATGERRVRPGAEVQIATSVRLVCGGVGSRPPAGLQAEVDLRRDDGGAVVRRVPVRAAAPLLDVAATVCAVRPELRDYELSGPVAARRTG